MAYDHARFGICRFGAAVFGLVNKNIDVRSGAAQISPWREVKFSIQSSLDGGPSMCRLLLSGPKPTKFQDLVLRRGTADGDRYWAGTVMSVASNILLGPVLRWDVTAVDWSWLLSRYKTVTAAYRGLAVNVILYRLLRDFSDPASGFLSGYCPGSLTPIDEIRFDNVPLYQAITSLAKAANAFVRIRPNKHIDIAQEFPDGNMPTLDDEMTIREFGYAEEGAYVANRVLVVGRGSRTTEVVPAAASAVPVEDCGVFSAGGGFAQSGQSLITYTSRSTSSGPGSLLGCSGIAVALEHGATVSVLAIDEDAAAQTALATALGGGQSGVAEIALTNDRLSDAEARAVAASYLAFYKPATGVQSVDFTIDDARYRPGKIATLNLSDPVVVAGDFRIQSVEVSYDDDVFPEDVLPRLQHRVSARIGRRAGILDVMVAR